MANLKDDTILNYDEYQDQYGSVVPPIYQNSLFTFDGWDEIDKAFDHKNSAHIYSRLMNPTVEVAEKKIAALCRGEKAKLCASGMAAITSAILHCVNAGDHMITLKDIYGPATTFISTYLVPKFNVEVTFVDGRNVSAFEEAIQDNTTLIYLESPASLTLTLQDIRAISKLAKQHNIKTVIDNTWASPIFQKPLTMGIDIEVHSVSKYLAGHSDIVAGVVVSDRQTTDAILNKEHELLGAKMAPFEGWLVLRSLRTLSIRMKAIQAHTMAVATFLENHSMVSKVYYPGLKSFEQYDLGKAQMTGYSGLLSFELNTDVLLSIKTFVNGLQLFSLGVSWGGHDSLVYAPAISYLKELPPEKFKAMGIVMGLVRISVGLEDPEDLIADLKNGLDKIA